MHVCDVKQVTNDEQCHEKASAPSEQAIYLAEGIS